MEKNNIDKFFKEGLLNPDISFSEEHWAALEKRLNTTSTKKKRILWVGFLSAAALALIFLAVILRMETKEVTPLNQVTKTEKAPKTNRQIAPLPAGKDSLFNYKNESAINPPKDHSTAFLALLSIDTNRSTKRIMASLPKVTQIPLPGSDRKALTVATQPKSFVRQMISANKLREKKEPAPSRQESFSLAILAAPDLTRIQGVGPEALSPNLGVASIYKLTNKVSISVGLLYSRKNYSAPFNAYNYSLPSAYAQSPTQIKANCDVLDLPIEVSYEIFNKHQLAIKVNGGLSSYFMLREKYHFIYASTGNTSNYPLTSLEVNGENSRLFGIGNIAISFEKQVTEKMSIGIKPFFKIPFSGVGIYNTKLASKGIALSINLPLGKHFRSTENK